jgi:hypothetical protein
VVPHLALENGGTGEWQFLHHEVPRFLLLFHMLWHRLFVIFNFSSGAAYDEIFGDKWSFRISKPTEA